jgi:hypothetical protein
VHPLSRISPYISVMSVITVMVARKPLTNRVFLVTLTMTMTRRSPNTPGIDRHVENPIGIGKSTAHDAHDGDDDELQGFSKWGGGTLL